jgi:hypothetical protein
MFLLVGLAATVGVLDVNLAHGFLFWPDKPAKPQIGIITNPGIIEEFDKFYDKYPNINQEDVNELHADASTKCFTGASKIVAEEDPNSFNSPFGQAIGFSLCKGIISGTIENYLDGLGIAYKSRESGEPPTLIKE